MPAPIHIWARASRIQDSSGLSDGSIHIRASVPEELLCVLPGIAGMPRLRVADGLEHRKPEHRRPFHIVRIPRPYLNEDEADALTETKRADMNAKCSMWRMTHTSRGTRTRHHSLKPHLFQLNMVGNVHIGRRRLGGGSGG